MKTVLLLTVFLSLTTGLQAQGARGVRVLLGLTDTAETKWDGSASARGAKISGLEPWRFEKPDELLQNNSWRLSTHPIRLFGAAAQAPRPVVANGVIIWLDSASPDATLQIQTAQGNFDIRLAEIPYGVSKKLLDGRVMVDRVPSYRRLTESADEQDYPAAATAKDGSVWIAWMEFKHHADHNGLRANMTEAPANFDRYKEPPGGDQIFARRYARRNVGRPDGSVAARRRSLSAGGCHRWIWKGVDILAGSAGGQLRSLGSRARERHARPDGADHQRGGVRYRSRCGNRLKRSSLGRLAGLARR